MREKARQELAGMRFGLFYHYLDGIRAGETREQTAARWNARVDSFDVSALARQLHELKVPYFFLTIGQCTGLYCAPNETFDRIMGQEVSFCAKRDLISDLSDALAVYGIKLGVYLPHCPATDPTTAAAFGFTEEQLKNGPTFVRNEPLQRKWEACIADWSRRFGRKVFAWWIDGVGVNAASMFSITEPNYDSFTRAIRTGNPDALVALNGGIYRSEELRDVSPKAQLNADEDFTAGEVDIMMFADGINWEGKRMMNRKALNGEVLHMLSYLGQWWGAPHTQGPRLNDRLAAGITEYVNDMGGVVTWDLPFMPDGTIGEEFVEQVRFISERVRRNEQ